jgi:hypothetical protein
MILVVKLPLPLLLLLPSVAFGIHGKKRNTITRSSGVKLQAVIQTTLSSRIPEAKFFSYARYLKDFSDN